MALPVKLINFCLEKVSSFSEYLPYFTYDPDVGLYHLIDGSVGFIFDCQPLPGAGSQVADALTGLYSMYLPPGSSIQVNLITLPVTAMVLESLRKGRVKYQNLIEKRIALYRQSVDRYAINDKFAMPLKDSTLLISVKFAHPDKQPAPSVVKKAVQQMLEYTGLHPIEVTPAMLINLLYRIFNPGHPDIVLHYDNQIEIRNQIIFGDNIIRQTGDGMSLENGRYKLYSLSPKQYPPEWYIWMNGALLGDDITDAKKIKTPFMVTLNCIFPDQAKSRKTLQTRATLVTNQMIGPLAQIIPKLRKRKESYDIVLDGIDSGQTLGYGGLNVIVWGKDNFAAEAAQTIESHFRTHAFIMQRDKFITANMLLQSLPLALTPNPDYIGVKGLWRGKTMMSSNFASLCPIVSEWKGTRTPTLSFVGRKGQFIALDLYDNPSRNAVVSGKTGGGKSFFVNELILNYLSKDAQVWIIDVGRSYYKLCHLLNGEFIDFGDTDRDFCLNPFTFVQDFAEVEDVLKAVVAQMASPSRVLTDLEASMVSKAVEDAWNDKGNASGIIDVRNHLAKIKDPRAYDLATMLHDYAEGPYARYFNGPANLTFDKDFVVLELEEFKSRKKLRSVVLLLLIYDIQNKMYGDRKRQKLLMIDEAWDLFGDNMANAGTFIEEAYRRVRKYAGAIITITQSINDYLTIGSVGEAILQNSDFKFFLKQNEQGLQAASSLLNKTELNFLSSLATLDHGYSEIFIKSPIGTGIARLVVDEFSNYLYTSTPEDFDRLQKAIQQGESVETAIENLIKEKHQGASVQ